MSLAALVLAGSRPGRPDPVAQAAGVSHKALALAGGETLLARVVGALRGASVSRVVVSTAHPQVAEAARALEAEVVAAAPDGPAASVLAAQAVLGAPLLVTTADHALLEPEWVARFLADAPVEADVCALLARRERVEADAPCTRRTYLRLADGEWSGCNLFLFRTARGFGAARLWRRAEARRKRPWRLAALVGPATLLRYATGRLSLEAAVARLGSVAAVRAAAVACPFALCAVDVDTPDDLGFVRDRLDAQRGCGRQVTVAETA